MIENLEYDMEASGFFPKLREVLNMPDADVEVMHDVSDYIVWMTRSNRELSFDLSEDELARA